MIAKRLQEARASPLPERVEHENKSKKIWKKCLTKRGSGGNINRSSARTAGEWTGQFPLGKALKKVLKSLKKVLDKGETRW